MLPLTRFQGDGGTIEYEGKVIGRLGAWAVRYWGDTNPYFRAQGCSVAAFWVSAGPERLTVRPSSGVPGHIEGDVRDISQSTLSLGNITWEGAANNDTTDI